MKLSLVKNDKSTYWDEVVFGIITLLILAAGIALVILQPHIWVFDSYFFICIGVLMIVLAAVYIPCLIYRFLTNDRKEK